MTIVVDPHGYGTCPAELPGQPLPELPVHDDDPKTCPVYPLLFYQRTGILVQFRPDASTASST